MDNRNPLILVSNDDSYNAAGVHHLIDRLVRFADVVCVCPDAPQSGKSMAITVNDALRITHLPDYKGAKMYKVNGTPCDCVKLAMHNILNKRPDMVVTGINHGSNSSINVLYSGTMGAAMEGAAFGIPSIGFSLCDHDMEADFKPCYKAIDLLVQFTLKYGLPEGICLNVNIPKTNETPEEIRLATPCKGSWNDEYKEYIDPSGNKFYWLTGHFVNHEPDNELTDEWCLNHDIISVVPVNIDSSADIKDGLQWLPEVLLNYRNK